jgi:hypothetical protein
LFKTTGIGWKEKYREIAKIGDRLGGKKKPAMTACRGEGGIQREK